MQYTIGEKIAYYQKKLLQKDLSERQRNEIKQRLQSLYRMKRKYGVVYMEDERFFRKPSRDGHHYIVSDIDSKENISAHRVTHHARGNEPLTGFDGKSRLQGNFLPMIEEIIDSMQMMPMFQFIQTKLILKISH